MDKYWKIHTQGDPLGTLQNFIMKVWEQGNLAGMLVPLNDTEDIPYRLHFIENPVLLNEINPFNPVMIENAARRIPLLKEQYKSSKLGVILRPCEMRALIEMVKHDSFSLDGLLTICIDCLKTVPLSDYQWRLDRKTTTDGLTKDVLRFARQGGIVAYRYRSACQTCVSPQAQGADINISILGLPVRDQMLIHADDEILTHRYSLDDFTDGEAAPEFIQQHEQIVAKMDARHYHKMEQMMQGLEEILPRDLDGLITQLETCTPCETCLDVCPICAIDRPVKDPNGHFKHDDITRWLVSCAGCGMCEQACPSHYPLSSIFRQMRDELSHTWDYVPGISLDHPLPIM